MPFFKKKKKEEESQQQELDPNAEPEVAIAPPEDRKPIGDISIGLISADLERLKAQFSSFYEMQKMSNERFATINEQIGEIRSLLLARDKDMGTVQAKASEAVDLVKTVQPEKLMVQVRKVDGKVEALKSNIESNEIVIKNMMDEIKEMRNRLAIFKGIDQIVELSNDVKKEILTIKKINATTERHADRVSTLFGEMNKTVSNFNTTVDVAKNLEKEFKSMISEIDNIKIKISESASRKDIEGVIQKFTEFEKHANNLLGLMTNKFKSLEKDLRGEIGSNLKETEKLLVGFKELAVKTPDLDKYFNLISEEAKKAHEQAEVQKIDLPSDEEPAEEKQEKKKGFFSKMAGKLKKKEGDDGAAEEPTGEEGQ